jgi:hypothetical protein
MAPAGARQGPPVRGRPGRRRRSVARGRRSGCGRRRSPG